MWFKNKRKKQEQTGLRKMVDLVGMDATCQRCAEILGQKLTTMDVFHQFVLEELDSARQGNAAAREFVLEIAKSQNIKEAEYVGALDRSFSEVDGPDGPQQALLRMTMEFVGDQDSMVEFRTGIVRKMIEAVRVGTPGS